MAATKAHTAHDDVPPDAIAVKVGQTLYVTFTAEGDELKNPLISKTMPSATESFLTIQLTRDGPTPTLVVTNGYDRTVTYQAIAHMRGRRADSDPPAIPVKAGLQSIITLGAPCDEMQLFDFHLTF